MKRKTENIKQLILNSKGVTLLELMVSVSLFTITLLMTTQIFKVVIDGQRQAVASQNMQENIRYAFEKMGKEIRTARKDDASTWSGACSSLGKVYLTNGPAEDLTFVNYHNECIRYFISDGRLKVWRKSNPAAVPVEAFITPTGLNVQKIKFTVTDNGPTTQAKVIMKMQVQITSLSGIKQTMVMETALSSRFYE